ncbi:hypothetical protein DB321_09700 [Ligilactobacillus salivarius]|uniref:Uncharacterized protein n=2 Tax=Ligilactobacillus salivarius TaxID=1624 RepID=C2EII6_9LACO|nr:hypothetical protein [Ligilactobacillus salivarius]ATP38268.1 hypothetical protein CR531_08885 [Ligilactobacillus salivarius]EEJ73714.1 hypothetical protein HMPREF0545_1458 [Ligilactobacillus salivarius DSM 20555 = ATCC 11741]KRM68151.1 hypothetical protein FC55_GL001357 [Ligilactobacillus salivarius DSM 20555 = ATCC 11741]MBE7938454.1 hypothetical protein [Ligilactobacillus salivarius]MDG9756072.1 hypothetical protein [Ligilactobacillus salivarius]
MKELDNLGRKIDGWLDKNIRGWLDKHWKSLTTWIYVIIVVVFIALQRVPENIKYHSKVLACFVITFVVLITLIVLFLTIYLPRNSKK